MQNVRTKNVFVKKSLSRRRERKEQGRGIVTRADADAPSPLQSTRREEYNGKRRGIQW